MLKLEEYKSSLWTSEKSYYLILLKATVHYLSTPARFIYSEGLMPIVFFITIFAFQISNIDKWIGIYILKIIIIRFGSYLVSYKFQFIECPRSLLIIILPSTKLPGALLGTWSDPNIVPSPSGIGSKPGTRTISTLKPMSLHSLALGDEEKRLLYCFWVRTNH